LIDIHFNNQVVLVTGAGRGLGAAYAKLFAARGAHVVVHDAGVNRDGTGHDPTPALSVVEEIRSSGGSALAETQNLSDRTACLTLINNVLTKCERLDVLVHSAGLVTYKGIEETTETEWERSRHINIEAPFSLSQAVWPIMKRQQYGRIIFSVSGYGLKSYENSDVTAYGVGKAAQYGLMNGLAGEGKPHGIFVNAISPVAATRIFRRTVSANELSPESVAPGVVLLGSKACPFTGKVLQAAGGRFAVGEFNAVIDFELGPDATPEQVLQAIDAGYGAG
jgi:NAD(P)-dependent dehydrogenase (short-subunit alcohol dehydrogenase family)